MKKFVVVLLALAMLLALCACGKKQEEASVVKVGLMNAAAENEFAKQHMNSCHTDQATSQDVPGLLKYDNLNSILLALGAGEINVALLNKSTVDYVIAHNDKYIIDPNVPVSDRVAYKISMLTTDTNTELYGILDGAIKELKANGKLAQLTAEYITAGASGNPTPAALPTFEGAKTYKIAVTGDLPPMDFVTADGHAAGFNVALLSAIANIAQVNFELVPVDTGARVTALTASKVDAVFWTVSYHCRFCGEHVMHVPAGMLVTETYFEDSAARLILKPAA